MKNFDCVIVGAGGVGLSLAIALAQLNYQVLVVEKDNKTPPQSLPPIKQRTLALSYASYRIFQILGIWESLAPFAIPIQEVAVSVKGQFGTCRIQSQDLKVPALGYVVGLSSLEEVLAHKCQTLEKITFLRNATLKNYQQKENLWQLSIVEAEKPHSFTANLLIAADGTHSLLRKDAGIDCQHFTYDHVAIMLNLAFKPKKPYMAIERFLAKGALAFLPWQEELATCVYTVEKAQADYLMQLADVDFIKSCQEELGFAFGKIETIGKRVCIPLSMSIAKQQIASQFLLMGNSAHTLHPIAAQGLNLSLRDIWQLRTQLLQEAPCHLGSSAFLQTYVKAREADQKRMVFATDKIARFMSGGPLPMWLRSKGMLLFDCMAPLKNQFSRYSLGLV